MKFYLCFLLLFIEAVMLNPEWKKLGHYGSPVVWFLAGLIPLAVLLFSKKKNVERRINDDEYLSPKQLAFLVYSVSMLIVGFLFFSYISHHEINPKYSDIIPAVRIYNQRLLSGQAVYVPMEDFGYTIYPNYLTMQWAPFSISTLTHTDERWLTFLLVFVAGLLLVHQQTKNSDITESVFKALLLPLTIGLIIFNIGDGLFDSIELIDVAFYLFLAHSIFSKNNIWRGVAISFCLMSRFSFLFWLPTYFLILLLSEGWTTCFKIGGTVAASVFLLYVLPFPIHEGDMSTFLKGMSYYNTVAGAEWEYSVTDANHHLNRGLGFAWWYKEHSSLSLESKVAFWSKFQQVMSLGASLLCAGFFVLFRKRIANPAVFSLVSLKFCLLIFYGFLTVTFPYLFVVPLSLSAVVLMRLEISDW